MSRLNLKDCVFCGKLLGITVGCVSSKRRVTVRVVVFDADEVDSISRLS